MRVGRMQVVYGREAEPVAQLRGSACEGCARDKVALVWEGEPVAEGGAEVRRADVWRAA